MAHATSSLLIAGRREDFHGLEEECMDQMYERGGTLNTTDTGVSVFAGTAFGGGTAVNWACSLRTPGYTCTAMAGPGGG